MGWQKILDINDRYSLLFYIEVDKNIVFGFTIAENGKRKNVCNQGKFGEITKQIIVYDDIKLNGTYLEWWICWKYPKNKLDFYQFDSDIIFN